jgi:hypothetical protein
LTDNVKGGLAALDEAEQSIKKAFPGNSPLLARFLKNKLGDLPECVEDAEVCAKTRKFRTLDHRDFQLE